MHSASISVQAPEATVPLNARNQDKRFLILGGKIEDFVPHTKRKPFKPSFHREKDFGRTIADKGGMMNELVKRLSTGKHAVEIGLRPNKSIQILRECVERGYLHIRFTETKGGTELGVRLDRSASDLSAANFQDGIGNARFVGTLRLNYVQVRCIADIDLQTFGGYGHLEVLEDRLRASQS